MQNLPVTATPPVISAQPPASADNTAQATESFGNVLARQRASTSVPEGNAANSKQGVSSKNGNPENGKQGVSSQSEAASSTADSNGSADGMPASDAAGAAADDMLATLLPASDKADTKEPSTDGAITLPGDVLTGLLPASAANGITKGLESASEKNIKGDVLAEGGGKNSRKTETPILGETGRSAGKKVTAQTLSTSGDTESALSRVQGSDKQERAAAASAHQEKAFNAALQASVNAGAKAAKLDMSTVKMHAQPDAPAAPEGLSQNGIAPVAASQNGAAQAAQAVINTPLTNQAWGNEFGQKITWMATQQNQTAELHLNPPNLGPLDVVLNVSGDQATALFTSPHAAVRDAVEQALPRLRDMMADNGITLGNAMVSDQSPKDQQAEQRQAGGGQASREIDAGITTGSISSSVVLPARRHQGMVDTFV